MKRGHLSNERAQDRFKSLEETIRERHEKDLRDLMATPFGRRFVYRLCFDTCNLLGETFTGNSETFWREGQRAVGAKIWTLAMKSAPSDAVRALAESSQADAEAKALLQAATADAARESEDGDGDFD